MNVGKIMLKIVKKRYVNIVRLRIRGGRLFYDCHRAYGDC